MKRFDGLGRFVRRTWFGLLILDVLAKVLTGWVAIRWGTQGAHDPLKLGYVFVVELIVFVILLARAVYLLPGLR
jgi:hypothetical protein